MPSDLAPNADAIAKSVLGSAGFVTASLYGTDNPSDGGNSRYWIGERGIRRRSVTSSTAVIPIVAVFVAGSILGGLDAYIVGSPLVGIFWVLGAAVASLVFWVRFGGTYDSDLVMVTVARASETTSATTLPVVFWGARIRSQNHSDVREPSVVSGPLKLAAEIGALVREFERRTSPRSARAPLAPRARPTS